MTRISRKLAIMVLIIFINNRQYSGEVSAQALAAYPPLQRLQTYLVRTGSDIAAPLLRMKWWGPLLRDTRPGLADLQKDPLPLSAASMTARVYG